MGFLLTCTHSRIRSGIVSYKARLLPLFPIRFTGQTQFLLTIIFVGLSFGHLAAAQNAVKSEEYEVNSIEFIGNAAVSSSELLTLMSTRETPGFFSKFLYATIGELLGRKNEYFDPEVLGEDVQNLLTFYNNRGFWLARIDTQLAFDPGDACVDITLHIVEGSRSLIDTIIYKGTEQVPYPFQVELQEKQLLRSGDPYDRGLLDEEVNRVMYLLSNYGYPSAVLNQGQSRVERYASTNNIVVRLSFDLGRSYYFGDISIVQEVDSMDHDGLREDITDDIIFSQMDYNPGDIYSAAKRLSSERNLNRLGIFELAVINVKIPPAEDTTRLVPSIVAIRPKDKHELAPELLVSDENNSFNLGTGIAYTNRNFLGGARTFTTRLRFRTQTLHHFPDYFATNSNAVSTVDLTFEMLQPYIITNRIKGSWTFSLIINKQQPYRQEILRNKFGFTNRLTDYNNGFLDWTLEQVRLKRNTTYPESSADPVIQEQLRQLKEQENQVQFNSILSFTIQRDRSNDIFSPSQGYIHSGTVTESGLLPLLLKGAQPDLPFTQFYRISGMLRWYHDLSRRRLNIIAAKIKAGFEDKYGETRSNTARTIPQDHRFYAGGGGSVRGWNSRDLSATGDPRFGGNLAFEGSFELRTNLLQSVHDQILDKFWTVLFLDIGNVWGKPEDLQLKDVAIATGFGIRYETFFGPFRIDYGMRIYNPRGDASQRKWITEKRLFGETFLEGIIHFGIGHAF